MRSSLFLAAGLAFLSTAAWANEPIMLSPPTVNTPVATVETSLGIFTIALDTARAPQTVANFERYAREGHFDGTVFYRVEPGFVVQAGSYLPDGTYKGGQHQPIPLEANNGLHNMRGAVAMARQDDPNSANCEFFIDLNDNTAALDQTPGDTSNKTGYAVFGRVVAGMDVVDGMAAVDFGGHGPFPRASTPYTPIVIIKVSISGN